MRRLDEIDIPINMKAFLMGIEKNEELASRR